MLWRKKGIIPRQGCTWYWVQHRSYNFDSGTWFWSKKCCRLGHRQKTRCHRSKERQTLRAVCRLPTKGRAWRWKRKWRCTGRCKRFQVVPHLIANCIWTCRHTRHQSWTESFCIKEVSTQYHFCTGNFVFCISLFILTLKLNRCLWLCAEIKCDISVV